MHTSMTTGSQTSLLVEILAHMPYGHIFIPYAMWLPMFCKDDFQGKSAVAPPRIAFAVERDDGRLNPGIGGTITPFFVRQEEGNINGLCS